MPFIPHTDEEIQSMLDAIGAASIDDLFDEIPPSLRSSGLRNVPPGLSEMEVSRLMRARAEQDTCILSFLGAGAYEHYIPAAVWELTTRGEFYTAYTPYQAEASQGTLQLLYEFQSMMAQLTAMDVSNASLYEGASALAEAVLMAVRANRKSKSKTVLIPRNLHPVYRKVVRAIVKNQDIILKELDYERGSGRIDMSTLPANGEDITALIVPQPNFFGVLEDVDALTDWGHQRDALVIACINPLAVSILKPPGLWGGKGADIACGEGQPLGIPLSSGGPYFGFLCCKQEHVRQVPGRIIGKTVDLEGKPGFALTLQAREQHIRRSKATSNICTNQGLMTTAATIYMSLMGAEGLSRVARQSHNNTIKLQNQLSALSGVTTVFNSPLFHECVLQFNQPIQKIIDKLTAQKIIAGYPLQQDYPELENCLLVCVTETKTDQDIDTFVHGIKTALGI